MVPHQTLKTANFALLTILAVFAASVYFAYIAPPQSLVLNVGIHISMMLLAGFFKLAYVIRLHAMQALGLVPN